MRPWQALPRAAAVLLLAVLLRAAARQRPAEVAGYPAGWWRRPQRSGSAELSAGVGLMGRRRRRAPLQAWLAAAS